ncbi:dihydroorotase [Eisenibacter elegans]|jgi:dihydroorotase|uniref:dihydroorotase n=1 Tax=Eisenibacter elegans TaxID=997 RepID=UPI0003FD3BF4|nr:dihydroorotase [Eisenibacter elegans]
MKDLLIKEAQLINEGQQYTADLWVRQGRIEKIATNIQPSQAVTEIAAEGQYLLPGVIDDQVHFREPGLTAKADIYHEARAAVAGGTTSFMEMPNTVPNTLTQSLLEEKYQIGAQTSLANYSFFMGASNDNLEEVLRTDINNVCGIKIFMGSSTGNMLVDNAQVLEQIFAQAPMLIATHCEDEATVRAQAAVFQERYGDALRPEHHPLIRNVEACILSSRLAIDLARKHNTRLHILHISTADEVGLFDNQTPLAQKRITSEVCVHHLTYSSEDYAILGNQIKCNPAIKAPEHREGLWKGLLDNHLDIIATDHAPHTWDEKQQPYSKAPAGVPQVQTSLLQMLEHARNGKLSLIQLVEKMCHAPAVCFQLAERGFLREGYWADLVLVDPAKPYLFDQSQIAYKCAWSPWVGQTFSHTITHTIVSGHIAYQNGQFDESRQGMRLQFER